jgi:hypothetical protein
LGACQALTVKPLGQPREGAVGCNKVEFLQDTPVTPSQFYCEGQAAFAPPMHGDDGSRRVGVEERCMAPACMAAASLPEASSVNPPPRSSNLDQVTSSPVEIADRGRCCVISFSPTVHVDRVNSQHEKGPGFPVEKSIVGEICSLPFTLSDFPPLGTSGGINGDERDSHVPYPSSSNFQNPRALLHRSPGLAAFLYPFSPEAFPITTSPPHLLSRKVLPLLEQGPQEEGLPRSTEVQTLLQVRALFLGL